MELSIVLNGHQIDRLGRVMDAMRARNPDLRDSVFLTFVFEIGLLEAERLYRLPPMTPGEPSGIYADLLKEPDNE